MITEENIVSFLLCEMRNKVTAQNERKEGRSVEGLRRNKTIY